MLSVKLEEPYDLHNFFRHKKGYTVLVGGKSHYFRTLRNARAFKEETERILTERVQMMNLFMVQVQSLTFPYLMYLDSWELTQVGDYYAHFFKYQHLALTRSSGDVPFGSISTMYKEALSLVNLFRSLAQRKRYYSLRVSCDLLLEQFSAVQISLLEVRRIAKDNGSEGEYQLKAV